MLFHSRMSSTPLPSNSSTIPHPLPSIPLYSPLLSLSPPYQLKILLNHLSTQFLSGVGTKFLVYSSISSTPEYRSASCGLTHFVFLINFHPRYRTGKMKIIMYLFLLVSFVWKERDSGFLFLLLAYENRNVGTSQFPLRKTGYPPTKVMTNVPMRP